MTIQPYYDHAGITIYHGDVRDVLPTLPDQSVNTIVTSPPYWGLRDYGVDGQIGLERTPEEYVATLVGVFRECRRVLRDNGTLWLNLGDSYTRDVAKGGSGPNGKHDYMPDYGLARKIMSESKGSSDSFVGRADRAPVRVNGQGLKPKDLVGIPWRVAFALQADGWYLRTDIIWHKPNPMPESVTDRPTKSHEYIFLLSKSQKYYYDHEAVKEVADQAERTRADRIGGAKYDATIKHSDGSIFNGSATRNLRSVWTVATQPYAGAHFATFPPKLIEPCIKAGCPAGGVAMDPFHGAGTTATVARKFSCNYVGIEAKSEYIDLSLERLSQEVMDFSVGSQE